MYTVAEPVHGYRTLMLADTDKTVTDLLQSVHKRNVQLAVITPTLLSL